MVLLRNQEGSKDSRPRLCEQEPPNPPPSETRWVMGKAHLLVEEDNGPEQGGTPRELGPLLTTQGRP